MLYDRSVNRIAAARFLQALISAISGISSNIISSRYLTFKYINTVTGSYSDGRYSEKFGSGKCDLGSGLGLGMELGLGLALGLGLWLGFVYYFCSFHHWNSTVRNSINWYKVLWNSDPEPINTSCKLLQEAQNDFRTCTENQTKSWRSEIKSDALNPNSTSTNAGMHMPREPTVITLVSQKTGR